MYTSIIHPSSGPRVLLCTAIFVERNKSHSQPASRALLCKIGCVSHILSFLRATWRLSQLAGYWQSLSLNPFLPERSALILFTPTSPQHSASGSVTNTTTTPKPLISLAPIHDFGPESESSNTLVVLPLTLTAKYNDFCGLQAMAHHWACCPKDLFEHKGGTVLSEIDCDLVIIPETVSGTEYYNLLFINDKKSKQSRIPALLLN